jgi:ubiquinone/menaquinone biosynthesis C-methylase UbiE
MIGTTSPVQREAARIQTVYASRQKTDFRYSFWNDGHLFLVQERERQVLAALRRHGVSSLEETTILEIGCGTGHWVREFVKWGAQPEHITAIDLLEHRISEARRLCPAGVSIQVGHAAQLRLPSRAFDLVVQSTVFTSILDPAVKRQVAFEMLRVVKDRGLILWYDFRVDNPWNADVRGVGRREIRQLFPRCSIELRRITLAPPLLRRLATRSWLACYLLSRMPWLCTHYLAAIRKQ